MKLNHKIIFFNIIIFSVFVFSNSALATTYAPDLFTDELDGGPYDCAAETNTCSLREAIQQANDVGNGSHTINLSTGTYYLSLVNAGGDEDLNATGDLDIAGSSLDLSIVGTGTTSTVIDAESIDRVFEVVGTASSLELYDLTITGGSTTGNGGGILNALGSNVILDGVLVTANSAVNGGGIYLNPEGSAHQLQNSGITGNIASGNGGGIYIGELIDADFKNLTIGENNADYGGGIYSTMSGSSLNYYFLTIAGNTSTTEAAGVYSSDDSADQFFSSIIADNRTGGIDDDCSSKTIILKDYTILEDDSNCSYWDDSSGTAQIGSDPGLEDDIANDDDATNFAFNDASSSVAVNQVPAATCVSHLSSSPADQRGQSRTGYCDVGAFEYQDSISPNITITNNTSTYNTVECGDTYSDQGATATDDIDGTLTSSITTDTSGVDDDTVGSYSVTYDVDDLSTNSATTATRTVTVEDTTDPTVTLTGSSSVSINQGATYTDSGATATDSCDGSLTPTSSGSVDTNTPGTYSITYTAIDSSANSDSASRTVTVVASSSEEPTPEEPAPSDPTPDETTSPDDSTPSIVSITPLKNGKIRVNYSDDTSITYTIFSNNTTKKTTKVKQYLDTDYYLVLQALGKKISLVDVTSGTILYTKNLSPKKKYQNNGLKILTLRNKKWAVITSKNKKNRVRLALVKILINKEKLGKKVTALTKGKNIRVNKTVKKNNYLRLRNKKGKVLKKYFLNKRLVLKKKI